MSNSKVSPSEPSEEPIEEPSEEPLEDLEEEPIESISIKKIVKKLKQQHKKDESTVKEKARLKNGVPEHGRTDKKRKHSKSFYKEKISKERYPAFSPSIRINAFQRSCDTELL